MPFGIPITWFTLVHTLLSVVGLFAGCVLAGGWISGKQLERWSHLFLVTTVLTNVTGFGFPFATIIPSHIVGALSLVILPVAIWARYLKHLAGGWRTTYIVTSVVALYLNAFVLVVQLFKRIPMLIAAAPTQKEAPFLVAQVAVLVLFIFLGRASVKGMRGAAAS